MKYLPLIKFNFILIGLLAFQLYDIVHAQTEGSSYPYGMYIYNNKGIEPIFNPYLTGFTHYNNPNNQNENLLKFWNRVLKMNFFNDHQIWEENTPSEQQVIDLDYLKYNYIPTESIDGTIKHIYRARNVLAAGESHYLMFNVENADTNKIVCNTNNTNIAVSTSITPSGYKFTAKTNLSNSPIVNGIQVVGTDNNRHVIRPRSSNIIYLSKDDHKAKFNIRIIISNSTSSLTKLNVTLSNLHKSNFSSDPNNADSIWSGLSLRSLGKDTIYLPFQLDEDYKTPEGTPTAYYYAPGLKINCTMNINQSFVLESITLYDDLGMDVVEGEWLYTVNFKDILAPLNNYNPVTYPNLKQIIEIHDEPTIGNFIPAKTTIEYLKQHMSTGKSFFTYTTGIEEAEFLTDEKFNFTMNRYFKEVNPDYYAPHRYVFGTYSDGQSYAQYLSNIKTLNSLFQKNNVFKKNKNLLTKLISILQLNGDKREITDKEIISSAYLTLLNGFNGILYWTLGGQIMNTPSVGLYPKFPSHIDGNSNEVSDLEKNSKILTQNYFFDISKMNADKKYAVTKVGDFLNCSEGTGRKIGDLINAGKFDFSPILVGENSNYARFSLGESSKSLLIGADIVNGATGDIAPLTDKNLIGINYFSIPGENDMSYYLITNLNQDGHACKVRLYFNSSNPKNFLDLYTLNDLTQLNCRYYPKNGVALFNLPEDGAILLRVLNTSDFTFPKGLRFGAYAPAANSSTDIHLDKNFFSPDGDFYKNIPAQVEVISLNNINNNVSYTDLATFRVSNVDYSSTYIEVEFTKHLQDGNNVFTQQTPPSKFYIKRPFILNTPSSDYKIGPLAYDIDNNGIDELGCYIAYNKMYYIFMQGNGNLLNQLKTYPSSQPSTTPEYYSLNGYVLGAKYLVNSTLKPTFYIYNNYAFYMDKNANGDIDVTTEKKGMGYPYANGWGPIPFVGDWNDNASYEYGVFEWNNFYRNTIFEFNFWGNDGFSYFEFPYGQHNFKPIIWKPRNISSLKSNNEIFEVEKAAEIPSEYSISQNFPNPFNPATTIRFALPAESRVTLEVFNILGERVAELVNDVRPAGTMDVRFDGSNLASGIYIYKFNATSLENGKHFQKINKMLLLK